jgi:chorismate--pyruvate lyase
VAGQASWAPLAAVATCVPEGLLSWLAEPGLLTSRVRALCGADMRFRMLGPLLDAPLPEPLRARLDVDDVRCLLRDVEFRCLDDRIVFAQTVMPASTVHRYPWLHDLGDAPIGETLRRATEPLEREPLEYAELEPSSPLASIARGPGDDPAAALWARRALYRLGGRPILVQEVFLPSLLRVQRGRTESQLEALRR